MGLGTSNPLSWYLGMSLQDKDVNYGIKGLQEY